MGMTTAGALLGLGALGVVGMGCGAGDGDTPVTTTTADRPVIAATTPILGAVVREALGDGAEVRVIKGRGQPFLDNPLVAGVMAEVAGDLMVSRALLVDAGRRFTLEGGRLGMGVACHRISALVERALGRVMELMGSAGYAREWQLERYWRDVRTLRGLLGGPTLFGMEFAAEVFSSRGVLS